MNDNRLAKVLKVENQMSLKYLDGFRNEEDDEKDEDKEDSRKDLGL